MPNHHLAHSINVCTQKSLENKIKSPNEARKFVRVCQSQIGLNQEVSKSLEVKLVNIP